MTPLPFPFELDSLAPPGVVASFHTHELGAFYRLARFAWSSEPPCTLPDDGTRLAAIVGCSQEQLAELWPRILLAVEPFHGGRLLLPAAERIHRELSARQARRSAAGTKAILTRWGKLPGDDPGGGHDRGTGRIRRESESNSDASPRLQSSRSSALSLQRSSHPDDSQSAQTGIIGVLSAGARAVAEDRVARWRRDRCREMIEKAVAAWTAAGYADPGFGPGKISELLDGPHTTPARVETLVSEASYLVEVHRAGKSERRPRPLGLLIAGLGLSTDHRTGRARPPRPVALVASERWAKAEADALRTSEALAAIQARAAAIARGAPSTSTPTTKPAAG